MRPRFASFLLPYVGLGCKRSILISIACLNPFIDSAFEFTEMNIPCKDGEAFSSLLYIRTSLSDKAEFSEI